MPTKELDNTQRFALGAIFVYQFALLYRFQDGLDLNIGLESLHQSYVIYDQASFSYANQHLDKQSESASDAIPNRDA